MSTDQKCKEPEGLAPLWVREVGDSSGGSSSGQNWGLEHVEWDSGPGRREKESPNQGLFFAESLRAWLGPVLVIVTSEPIFEQLVPHLLGKKQLGMIG